MRYVNGMIGVALIVLALSYLSKDDSGLWSLIYGYGALVALLSMRSRVSPLVAWLGAIGATVAMFCYFALFFQMVPHLRGDWIRHGHESMYLVAAAFSMIPVLANFSCRLKGNGGLKTAEDPAGARRPSLLPFRLPAAPPWNSKRTHTDGSVRP
ncbi:MAG: hypothetical protein OXI90_11980 [Gammaproteobacteria bacterium]|nr:hypothetical protein [Gammaproteobacteria bacterium]